LLDSFIIKAHFNLLLLIADKFGMILLSGVREVKGDCFARSLVWSGGSQACRGLEFSNNKVSESDGKRKVYENLTIIKG